MTETKCRCVDALECAACIERRVALWAERVAKRNTDRNRPRTWILSVHPDGEVTLEVEYEPDVKSD